MGPRTETTDIRWTAQLLEQLTWHWEHVLRPRLDGLTDEEHTWEPVPGCWSIRPRAESTAPVQAGVGDLVAEFAFPEPEPPPVTTIAWRLGHVLVGILGMRNASHFGGDPVDYTTVTWPAGAEEALDRIDAEYERWVAGVAALDDAALARPVGAAEGPFADHPMAALVLHITREVVHHGAEVCLLRDLYRASGGSALA